MPQAHTRKNAILFLTYTRPQPGLKLRLELRRTFDIAAVSNTFNTSADVLKTVGKLKRKKTIYFYLRGAGQNHGLRSNDN